jgi:TonB family protein
MIATVCAVVPLLFTSARFGTAWFPLNGLPVVGPATGQEYKPVAKPKREPIRVSTIVQESKLMVKINPVLPKKALEAHVSGMVILQLAVNEDGDVYDVKVMRGHPLLDEAAVDAARQWRYSPTLLNGEPVPVVATANVMFANARLSLTMDQNGNLRDPVSQHEGDELIQSMRRSPLGVTINPSINAPMPVLHNVLRLLVSEGITEVQVAGFLIYDGRLFANAAAEGSSAAPPSMVVDNDRLAAIAKASGLVGNLSAREKPLLYYLFINEVGEIAGLRQVRGPHVAAVETELLHTRVISPGTRGGETIPVAVLVEVAVP